MYTFIREDFGHIEVGDLYVRCIFLYFTLICAHITQLDFLLLSFNALLFFFGPNRTCFCRKKLFYDGFVFSVCQTKVVFCCFLGLIFMSGD